MFPLSVSRDPELLGAAVTDLLALLALDLALLDGAGLSHLGEQGGSLGRGDVQRLGEHGTHLELVGEQLVDALHQLGIVLASRQLLRGRLALGSLTLLVLSVVLLQTLGQHGDQLVGGAGDLVAIQSLDSVHIHLADSHGGVLSGLSAQLRRSQPSWCRQILKAFSGDKPRTKFLSLSHFL